MMIRSNSIVSHSAAQGQETGQTVCIAIHFDSVSMPLFQLCLSSACACACPSNKGGCSSLLCSPGFTSLHFCKPHIVYAICCEEAITPTPLDMEHKQSEQTPTPSLTASGRFGASTSSSRLPSFTNLSHLNPFARRSVSQRTASVSGQPTEQENSKADHEDESGGPSAPTSKANRRGSWLPLPEKQSKALPRSLTFGNLSLSRRDARKTLAESNTMNVAGGKPDTGERIAFRSRIPSSAKPIFKRGSMLPRSDTEPLLPFTAKPNAGELRAGGQVIQNENTPPNKSISPSTTYDADVIFTAEPTAYWSGRFMSLNDRLRTETIDENAPPARVLSMSRNSLNPHAHRIETVFALLYASCASAAAVESLKAFHTKAKTIDAYMPGGDGDSIIEGVAWWEVVRAGKEVLAMRDGSGSGSKWRRMWLEPYVGEDPGGGRLSAARRGTFMERLLGRGQGTA